ncbi:alcohol oxidase [Collybia nuda]|uniref:Alcohol oxidase n=1 Tax=Collybia nuda TaxID=64659 RepID=A0A9P5XVT5_9AGAR|nr:alcohol oxidase [Collybia nuda]
MPIVSLQDLKKHSIDVLIIGGGTSGLVLAARYAFDAIFVDIITVLEAGEYHESDPLVDMPGMMTRAIHNPKYDWTYYTVPQKHCGGRPVLQSHGKGLGGSSLLNFMGFVRPSKEELDAFEQMGNPGWNWDTLHADMMKSELLQPPDASVDGKKMAASPDPALHGHTGGIAKSWPPLISELHVPLLDSLESVGVPRKPDNSDGRPVGAFLCPTTVDARTATRSYSAPGYYAPNKDLPNLLVVTGVYVTKVDFTSGKGGLKRATSVNVEKDGQVQTLSARKEIVLSAGTFHTPQLLELSGIGDSGTLQSLGIDCIVELPGVGENLQDHACVPVVVQVNQNIETFEAYGDPSILKKHQELYKAQQGMLAGLSSTFAFIPTKTFASESELQKWEAWANVSSNPHLFESKDPSVRRGIERQYEFIRGWLTDPNQPFAQILTVNGHYPVQGVTPDPNKRYITLLFAYNHPFSRGSVHSTSKDAHDHPSVDPNYLSSPIDSAVLAHMLSLTRRLSETAPFSDSVISTVVPSFDKKAPADVVNKFIGDTLATVHHPVGTASMLPRDRGGVVSPDLLVYGTENLRVVDCSVIPLQISANIQCLAYAIGEKVRPIIVSSSNASLNINSA